MLAKERGQEEFQLEGKKVEKGKETKKKQRMEAQMKGSLGFPWVFVDGREQSSSKHTVLCRQSPDSSEPNLQLLKVNEKAEALLSIGSN